MTCRYCGGKMSISQKIKNTIKFICKKCGFEEERKSEIKIISN